MRVYYYSHDEYRIGRDWIKVHQVEKDRRIRDQEKLRSGPLPQKKRLLVALRLMDKMVSKMLVELQDKPVIDLEKNTTDCLFELHKLLTNLKKRDLSTSIPFAASFSKNWNAMLESYIPVLLRRLPKPLQIEIKEFQKALYHYPDKSDYSLAYYLTNYAGEKWLPFPFITMVRDLHIEHANRPNESLLNAWTKTLSKIIKPLTGKKVVEE